MFILFLNNTFKILQDGPPSFEKYKSGPRRFIQRVIENHLGKKNNKEKGGVPHFLYYRFPKRRKILSHMIETDETETETDENPMPFTFVKVRIFGDPFLLVIREGETLAEVKLRIQKKLQVQDDEFSEWKFASVYLGRYDYLKDTDIVSTRFQGRVVVHGDWELYLGMEHSQTASESSGVETLLIPGNPQQH